MLVRVGETAEGELRRRGRRAAGTGAGATTTAAGGGGGGGGGGGRGGAAAAAGGGGAASAGGAGVCAKARSGVTTAIASMHARSRISDTPSVVFQFLPYYGGHRNRATVVL